MARKDIRLALMYRDMWQSSGKYMPRVDQLVRVAEPIINMGCFARVETNGGGFEQINLLYGENPNISVRKWTQPFNDAGIETQMLERGLNGLRMNPVPKDVRKLMFKVKKLQGTDISRSFDGLNNPRNLALSFEYAKEGGMIAQGALSMTVSPVHTVEYFINLAEEFIALGAEEICLKDMAGIARPTSVGKIVKGVRERYPDIVIQYHSHSTPGFSVASALEAARNGVDIIDVGMEPLSWGTGHSDLLTIHAMLRDAGFSVPDINMKAYMQVRTLTQEFVDDFLGYYISPKNREMNSLLIGPGLPGGMMGSLMSDLEQNLISLNGWFEKNNKPVITQDDLLVKLFDEVEYVWPRLGYPPLVTPFSQYVKNVALMNVIQMEKGKERWSMLDENTWNMILGQQGQLLGPLDNDIINLAKMQNRTFFTGDPQELYPDQLDMYRKKMNEKRWSTGQDDEELLEYAMHPTQYEAYKSGEAKQKFEEDVHKKRNLKDHHEPIQSHKLPDFIDVDIKGEKYSVKISYPDQKIDNNSVSNQSTSGDTSENGEIIYITSPLEGKFFLTKDAAEQGVKIGDTIKKGDTVAYVEAMKVINAITSDVSGTVVEILVVKGADVEEDQKLIKLI
ncbi:MAG: oxaloacetate decarboxylase [Saprospiraceae bacterium]|jgi:pyruvate carboxylase subunit B|nr:oxaloacetate decarboxylase [Saprospiraceae bacterium]